MDANGFRKFVRGFLLYNLATIALGAYVRASGSGDGCGRNWPLCGGAVVPAFHTVGRIVEYSHRVSVGLLIPLIALLVVWGRRAYPVNHPVRAGSLYVLLFTFTESIVGAGLVLFKLVAHNATLYRLAAMSAHLVNTFFLLLAISLTIWWADNPREIRLSWRNSTVRGLVFAMIAVVFIAVSGAAAALGDTLYPAIGLREAIRQDLSSDSPLLLRLRMFHPVVAVVLSCYVLYAAWRSARVQDSHAARRWARLLTAAFLVQMGAGALDVALRAPIPMQLMHLVIADINWVALALMACSALALAPDEALHAPQALSPRGAKVPG